MEDQTSGKLKEKDISLEPNSPKQSTPRDQQKSQMEVELNEIINDNTNFNSPIRKDETTIKKKQYSLAPSESKIGNTPEDLPFVNIEGSYGDLSHYISRVENQKVKDQLQKASGVMQLEPFVVKLIYEYLKKERQQHLIEQMVNNPNSQNDTAELVQVTLKYNLYAIARKALQDRKLKPNNRDLLKQAFELKSSGSIKFIAKLLLAGGPVFSQIDSMFCKEMQDQIIQMVHEKHDKAGQLLTELCKKYNIPLSFKFSLIREAFQKRQYGFLQAYLTSYDLIIESSQIVDMVLSTLKDPETFVYGVYFLQFISVVKLTEDYMLQICDIIEDYLENNILVISQCISPQATVSVLCDFVDDLIPRFKRYQIRLEGLRENLKMIAINFMEEVNDSLQLERLYLKKVLPVKDNLVELYFKKKEFYQDLLNYPIVEQFLRKHFNGKYKSDKNFMGISSTLKTLRGKNTQPVIKAQSSKKIEVLQQKQGGFFGFLSTSAKDFDGVHNWFQLGIWKTSSQFRLYLSIIIYFAFLVWILMTSLEFFAEMRILHSKVPHELLVLQNDLELYRQNPVDSNISKILHDHIIIDLKHEFGEDTYNAFSAEKKKEEYNKVKNRIQHEDLWDAIHELDPNYKDEIDELKKDEEAINNTLKIMKIFPFYFILTWFAALFEVINYLKKRNSIGAHLFHIVDTIQLGLAIFLAYEFFSTIDNHSVTLLEKIDALNILEKAQAATLFILWIKLLLYLKLTSKFGVIIRIIELSIVDIMNFLIILFIILMSFVTVFNILFEDSDEARFGNFFKTVRSCTEMILGNFATDSFETDKELGAIIVIVYMIITNVLALNLLIAILSTTYSVISDRSSVEFSNIVYHYQKFIKSTKRNTALVCAPAPLNLLTLPFQTVQVFNNSQALNDFTLSFIYGLELVFIFFPIFLVINLILSPFAYLMHFVNIARNNNTGKALVKIFLWLIVGLPYTLFYALIIDSIQFFKVCLLKPYVKETLEKIDYHSLQSIQQYAKYNSQETSVDLEEAVLKLTTQSLFQRSQQQKRTYKMITRQTTKQNQEKNDNQDEVAAEILETEMLNDELVEDLSMNKVLFLKEIFQKFCDHEDKIDFNHVHRVLKHLKMHKSTNNQGIVHCHNYQEIEGSLIKSINKMQEDSQKEEDFEVLKKFKDAQKG